MNHKRPSVVAVIALIALTAFLTACISVDPPRTLTSEPLQIELTCAPSDKSQLISGRQTAALYARVSGGGGGETTYNWSADMGTVEPNKDRANYTPPNKRLGEDTVTVTVNRNEQSATDSCTYEIVEIRPLGFQKGVALPSWWMDHYCSAQFGEKAIRDIANIGADSVQLVPTWYQPDLNANAIMSDTSKTTSDECLEKAIRAAHNNHLAVMLKPHVEPLVGYKGDIASKDPSAWFASYRQMIFHYADIAQNNAVEIFVVGTELKSMSEHAYTENWRALIREIKARYFGWLTYAANWTDHDKVEFWNDLDYMGIDAYFPLTHSNDPSREEILTGWNSYADATSVRNWADEIMSSAKAEGKQVIFTEIGYASQNGAAQEPWNQDLSTLPNPELQARLYEAALRTFWLEHDFKGLYWWFWDMQPDPKYKETGYVPKATALEELQRWYKLTPPAMPPTPTPAVTDIPTPLPTPEVTDTPIPSLTPTFKPEPTRAATTLPSSPPSSQSARGFNWETCAADNWVPQTYQNGQGIESVAGTSEADHTGECSLKLNARLQAQHPNFSQGEAFVDLGPAKSFNGVQITCWVYVPSAEATGQPDRWNGAQLFVKDASAEFKGEYGIWVNLDHVGWIAITLIPSTSEPIGGYMTPGFDPNNIKLIGVKIGTNSQASPDYAYHGPYYVDDCTW